MKLTAKLTTLRNKNDLWIGISDINYTGFVMLGPIVSTHCKAMPSAKVILDLSKLGILRTDALWGLLAFYNYIHTHAAEVCITLTGISRAQNAIVMAKLATFYEII